MPRNNHNGRLVYFHKALQLSWTLSFHPAKSESIHLKPMHTHTYCIRNSNKLYILYASICNKNHPSPNQCIIPKRHFRHATLACARVAEGKAMDAIFGISTMRWGFQVEFQHDLPCKWMSATGFNRVTKHIAQDFRFTVCWNSVNHPRKHKCSWNCEGILGQSWDHISWYKNRSLHQAACSPKDLSKLHCRSYAVHTDLYEPKCSLESPIHESGGIIIQGGVGVSPWCWWDWVLPQKMWKEQETGTGH